jgi:hypothetical protein
MGWFGFGGSRERDDRAFVQEDARRRNDKQYVHEAVRIDRMGKFSRLPDDRPRRRDRRW